MTFEDFLSETTLRGIEFLPRISFEDLPQAELDKGACYNVTIEHLNPGLPFTTHYNFNLFLGELGLYRVGDVASRNVPDQDFMAGLLDYLSQAYSPSPSSDTPERKTLH